MSTLESLLRQDHVVVLASLVGAVAIAWVSADWRRHPDGRDGHGGWLGHAHRTALDAPVCGSDLCDVVDHDGGDDAAAESVGGMTAYAWFVFEQDHVGAYAGGWL
jgi:hypothetical protein